MSPTPVQSPARSPAAGHLLLTALLMTALAVLLCADAGSAASGIIHRKLSEGSPDTREPNFLQAGPDGQLAFYIAGATDADRMDLYASLVRGSGPPYRLNRPPEGGGGNVWEDYQVSPDGQYVLYRSDQDVPGQSELYRVPAAGGAPAKLNRTLAEGEDVRSFKISPDGQKVVYQVEYLGGDPIYLFRVAMAGGHSSYLNAELAIGGRTLQYQISPDSQYVVYTEKHAGGSNPELWSTPLAGGGTTWLDYGIAGSEGVTGFKITPDSQQVVYVTSKTLPSARELYRAPIDGTEGMGGVRINLPFEADRAVTQYQISPDSKAVVYLADMDTDEKYELYSASIYGSMPLHFKLSPDTMIAAGDVQPDFKITPNSLVVIYRADLYQDQSFWLTGVLINGASPRHLNRALAADRSVTNFQITPNGLGVVFRSNHGEDGQYQLYSTYTTGGEVFQLTHLAVGRILINWFDIAPNNLAVVYMANQEDESKRELFSVPIAGGPALKWNVPFANPSGSAAACSLLPDSTGLVYMANAIEAGEYEPYSATIGFQVFLPVARR